MKKISIFALLFLAIVTLSACKAEDQAPVIAGADDVTILQGEAFDILEGVTATDEEDGDLTSTIETDGFVNSSILGEHAVNYTVTDSAGNTTRVTRIITVEFVVDNPSSLYNGDFSLGDAGWSFDQPGGTATFTVEEEVLEVAITGLGQEWWNLQVHQTISIDEGTVYKLSFDAKAEGPKRIGIGMEDTADGYVMLPGGDVVFELTTSFDTYEYYFTSDRTIDTAKFVIYLGRIGEDEVATTVHLDNLSVEEVTLDDSDIVVSGIEDASVVLGQPFDVMAGVTAEDGSGNDITANITTNNVVISDLSKGANYVVQYMVTDGTTTIYVDRIVEIVLGKENDWELFNTDFALGVTGWSLDFPVGTGTMTVVDGVLEAELTDLGDAWWHIQLFQGGISIEEGKTYVVSLDAKADGSKRIGLGIEDVADGYADLKGESIEWDLTTDWQTFTYSFTAPRTIDTTKYAIFLGMIAGTDETTTVYIDNFSVTLQADSNPTLHGIEDVTVVLGDTFDLLEGITASDFEDGNLTASITTSGTLDMDTEDVYTITYSVTDSGGNVTTQDRIITVTAEQVEDYALYNSGFDYGLNNWLLDFNAGTTGQGTVTDGVLGVEVTTFGDAWWHIQLHQDNRSVTLDTTYIITFEAKADGIKTIGVGVEDIADGYADITGQGHAVFDLTTDWQTFTFIYNSDRTIDTAKVVLFLGKMAETDTATTVYIDNVLVVESPDSYPVLSGTFNTNVTEGETFDPLAGVTATDYEDGDITANIIVTGTVDTSVPGDYTITYSITDSYGTTITADRVVTVNPAGSGPVSVITNPNMEGTDGWVFDFPGGTGTMEYLNNELVANLTDLSDAWWKIQLQQDGISIVDGKLYLVVVEMKSDQDRVIGLSIEDTGDGFADLKGESIEWSVTATYDTYYYVFRANRTIDTAKLALFLGQISGSDPVSTVTVNRFDMVEIDDYNILLNSNFVDDSGWNYDFPAGTGTMSVTDNVLTAALTDLGTAWWHIQLHQTDVSISAGTQYLVSFKVRSDADRRIGLGIEDPANSYADLKGESVEWDIGANWETVTYLFNSQDTITTAKFAIFLGQISGTDPISNVDVRDFVVIELP